jgi:transcriptional regulator with XRE-family HTH domain
MTGIANMPKLSNQPATQDLGADIDPFLAALGTELRLAREQLGWSRRHVIEESGIDIVAQTLGTYEFGTREIGLHRLFELCRALAIDPIAILDKVYRRAIGIGTDIQIDLAALAGATGGHLHPLRSWARLCIHELPRSEDTKVTLSTTALESMADLCGMEREEFIHAMVQNGVAHQADPLKVSRG